MFTTALALLLSLWSSPTVSPSKAETFDIDGGHSSVLFRVKHLGVANFYGRFNEVSGSFTIDEANPAASSVQLEIKSDSIDTANERRDNHLKSPDFFNVRQFPVIRFESTQVAKEGETWKVTGKLTLHGVEKEVAVELENVGSGETAQGYKAGYEGSFTLQRSDFGMTYMVGEKGLGDDVKVIVSFEGKRR